MGKRKVCSRCKVEKPLSEFYTNGRSKAGTQLFQCYCKPCALAKSRAWRKKNPKKVQAQRRRQWYNLTDEQYQALLAAQGGVCAICHKKSRYALHVEHRHSDHRVRGLVCKTDNRLLGWVRDNPDHLRRAAAYLEAPPGFDILPEGHQANPKAILRNPGGSRRWR